MTAQIVAAALRHASTSPHRPAIGRDREAARSWREIVDEACRLATWLDGNAAEGGVVATLGESGPGFWAGALAVFGSGRRLMPLTMGASSDELRRSIESFGTSAIVAHDVEDEGRCCAVVEPASIPAISARFDVHGRSPATPGILARGAGAALLLHSSGTTGRPRAVLREGAALDRVASTLVDEIALRADDHIVSTLPMQHSYGIEHAVLAPILAGASVCVVRGGPLERLVAALRDRATVMPAVPVMLELLAEIEPGPTALRMVCSAGAPLPAAVRERFERRWATRVRNLYGASEVGTVTLERDDGERPVRGVEVRVCASDVVPLGDCAVDEPGEVCVRSDAMFAGYVDPVAGLDRGAIVDGFFRTGDRGTLDRAGRLRLCGRIKLQLDVGGLKVDPEAIEAVLREHPLVRDVAVVALPLSATVTRLRAVVVSSGARDDEAGAAIRRFAGIRLAVHEVPRVVEFRDVLPRSASGKLLRGSM